MAAEISELSDTTESYRDLHAELHEALRILLRLEAVLIRFEPLLSQLGTSPMATRRAVRRAVRGAIPQDT